MVVSHIRTFKFDRFNNPEVIESDFVDVLSGAFRGQIPETEVIQTEMFEGFIIQR